MVNKYKFFDVFNENPDGSLSPRITILVNGVTFNPGVSFGRGVSFGGIDFNLYKNGYDIAGELINNTLIVKGFFKN
jgi:hypothetical protein